MLWYATAVYLTHTLYMGHWLLQTLHPLAGAGAREGTDAEEGTLKGA